MSSRGSISHWYSQLAAGDSAGAGPLWNHFFAELVGLADRRLECAGRPQYDEEDAAISAFKSFCLGVRRGNFPNDLRRNDLWRLLATITLRKVADAANRRRTRKRSQSLGTSPGQNDYAGLEQYMQRGPTVEMIAEFRDEMQRLLRQLDSTDLQQIALWKLEGWTNVEIAEKSAWSLSSIERKLRTIRAIWSQGMTWES